MCHHPWFETHCVSYVPCPAKRFFLAKGNTPRQDITCYCTFWQLLHGRFAQKHWQRFMLAQNTTQDQRIIRILIILIIIIRIILIIIIRIINIRMKSTNRTKTTLDSTAATRVSSNATRRYILSYLHTYRYPIERHTYIYHKESAKRIDRYPIEAHHIYHKVQDNRWRVVDIRGAHGFELERRAIGWIIDRYRDILDRILDEQETITEFS
jgi:hypothetical protein